eukprot:CAMPEP_0181220944 /NCGR_PEP_ID=MMETSP1096-20121128/29116_1 /TAXON_ID=156174 ORGANISM="Chrysochromulina ericina, Strain CCMP281" /NCGR_SAMPLE_ID=MMETSP1096 /ASSEMBLY_ACC=CAM_ASM_000453 /LENGTH=64 /DNA_ID=CAMNT_0023313499 /DNA_START=235 /DNA_END=425 /DNA_ORIENTATION=+
MRRCRRAGVAHDRVGWGAQAAWHGGSPVARTCALWWPRPIEALAWASLSHRARGGSLTMPLAKT